MQCEILSLNRLIQIRFQSMDDKTEIDFCFQTQKSASEERKQVEGKQY